MPFQGLNVPGLDQMNLWDDLPNAKVAQLNRGRRSDPA